MVVVGFGGVDIVLRGGSCGPATGGVVAEGQGKCEGRCSR